MTSMDIETELKVKADMKTKGLFSFNSEQSAKTLGTQGIKTHASMYAVL